MRTSRDSRGLFASCSTWRACSSSSRIDSSSIRSASGNASASASLRLKKTFACAVPETRHSAANIEIPIARTELEDNSYPHVDFVTQLSLPSHPVAIVELHHHVGNRLRRHTHREDLELL